jgi:hypothetical protein
MSRYCKIVVLPEDWCHAHLARGFFQGRNVDGRAYDLKQRWHGRNGNAAAVVRWLCEEARLQSKTTSGRYGILAIVDEDGKGLEHLRNTIDEALTNVGLRATNPTDGRCLVLPMRNVETWMVWVARWKAAGGSTAPGATAEYQPVNEAHDYKRWRCQTGQPLPKESLAKPYLVGKALAALNPAAPPAGTPPALRAALQPLGDFLHWCRL